MNKSDMIKKLVEGDHTLSSRSIADVVGCTRRLVRKVRQDMGVTTKVMPRILIFDIETAPMEVYVWGLYKQRIPITNIIKDWSLLSWSAKWLFDSEIHSERVTTLEAQARSDESIMGGLWALLDDADLVIGHNAMKFDVRKANLRFALNGLSPPRPYRIIDTMKHAMKVFGSSSYKLDYLNKIFGNNPKMETSFSLWIGAVTGDEYCLRRMEEYNRFDVAVTEELYLSIRPWMKGHPNIGLYIDTEETVCTNCGNVELTWGGYYYTPAGKYKSFRCSSCGAIGRSRFGELSKEERARLLLSVAN